MVNGNEYNMPYYLADGIYPSWPVLIKTLRNAPDAAGKLFSLLQEAARKDIECAFGVLQARWGLICQPCRLWDLEDANLLIITAIILHNMIVEERSESDPYLSERLTPHTPDIQPNHLNPKLQNTFANVHRNYILLRQEGVHVQLMRDLKTHNWLRQGEA